MTTFIEVLCEGSSDVPAVREVFNRRFGLIETSDFKIIPHAGRGTLPPDLLARPKPWRNDLLHQLPARLRAYAKSESNDFRYAIVVQVDADQDDWRQLESDLEGVLEAIDYQPRRVLFRVAVEETESWFIAEPDAVLAGYPKAKVRKLRQINPDAICGAWERLAEALGLEPVQCDGGDKVEWASAIAPHLSLEPARSPSLQRFIDGVKTVILAGDELSPVPTPGKRGEAEGPQGRRRESGRASDDAEPVPRRPQGRPPRRPDVPRRRRRAARRSRPLFSKRWRTRDATKAIRMAARVIRFGRRNVLRGENWTDQGLPF